MQIPQDIYDHIVHHVGNELRPSLHTEEATRHLSIPRSETRKRLATLRLVNWSFCRSASPWLFRHINAQSVNDSSGISPLERLINLSKSHYATHVYRIDFGFQRFNYLRSIARPMESLYVKDLAEFSLPLLLKFTNLRALEFREPALSLPQDMRNLYMDTVVSILRYVPLPSLRELDVTFSIPHDFGRFFPSRHDSLQIPIKDVMQRLRHLRLRVREFTNVKRGRKKRVAILPEHAAFPNKAHASCLFNVVELASNLESLDLVVYKDILDIDFLPFPSSLCLQCLCLIGVSVSYETLLALINQSAHKLQYIDFFTLELKSGTWQKLLLEMCKLPSLLDFGIEDCGYTLKGSSSHLADRRPTRGPFGPLLERRAIKGVHDFDLNALGILQRRINAKRIGLGLKPYKESNYWYISYPTEGCS